MSVGPQERSYVMFDISSLPPGATVTAAQLTVCRTNGAGPSRTHELRMVTSAWTETGLTWNTQPALSASATYTIAVPPSIQCITADVSLDVEAWVLGAANFGWRIVDTDEATAPLVEYATREDPVAGQRPTLSVTYTP